MPEIFERMRGLYTPVTELRRHTFVAVARFVLEGANREAFDRLPFQVVDTSRKVAYRCCTFREISVLRQRLRLAMGLALVEEFQALASEGIERAFTQEKVMEAPLVHVIRAGCERCVDGKIVVSDLCRRCIAHPCTVVCPKNAVSIGETRAQIDYAKCIKCGKCIQACPYQAITRVERPCAQACGVDAIHTDESGCAAIDQSKCVSCGLCVVSCPFGAIADKSEIAQVLLTLKNPENRGKIFAIVAPSFVGQFGRLVSPGAFVQGLLQLGFDKVMEVAFGADLDTLQIVQQLVEICRREDERTRTGAEKLPGEYPFIATSCCTSWVEAARARFPELSRFITDSYPPMVETAKKVKEGQPDAKVVFIGPCIAKKGESLRDPVRKWVDHVLTFEELAAIFVATKIDLTHLESVPIGDASALGRGYAVAGGVAEAILETAREHHGLTVSAFQRADTLRACLKMLGEIRSGSASSRLVEGMACPGGCVGGPGTLLPLRLAAREVQKFAAAASAKIPGR